MKRYYCLLLCVSGLLGWFGPGGSVKAQNNAATVAAREEAEDRYQRLATQVERLQENLDLHKQQISALEKSLRDLSEQVARANNNNPGYATRENLDQVAKQITKVDEARVADTKKIYESIDELQRILKGISTAPPPARPRPASTSGAPHTDKGPPANEEGFEHVVQKGDTLSGIVQAYRQKNIKVTSKAVMEANPNVMKWDRLRIGQKIFIPKPDLH